MKRHIEETHKWEIYACPYCPKTFKGTSYGHYQRHQTTHEVNLPSISSTFCVRIFRTNIVFSSYVWLGAKNSYEKRAQKTLMKLTPVVNFINILHTNFSYKWHFSSCFYVHVTRKSCRNDVHMKKVIIKRWWNWHQYVVDFTNILPAAFEPIFFRQKIQRHKKGSRADLTFYRLASNLVRSVKSRCFPHYILWYIRPRILSWI